MKYQIVYIVNGKYHADLKEYETEAEAKKIANLACLKCIPFRNYHIEYYIDYIGGGNREKSEY